MDLNEKFEILMENNESILKLLQKHHDRLNELEKSPGAIKFEHKIGEILMKVKYCDFPVGDAIEKIIDIVSEEMM